MAELMAIDPSFVAGNEDKLPRKLPTGVRTELTMNTSFGRFPPLPPKLRALGRCLHSELRVNALLLRLLAIFQRSKIEYTVVHGVDYALIRIILTGAGHGIPDTGSGQYTRTRRLHAAHARKIRTWTLVFHSPEEGIKNKTNYNWRIEQSCLRG